MRPILLAFTLLATAQAASISTPAPSIPAVGNPLREAIVNALRGPVEQKLKAGAITFQVSRLKVSGDWAFVQARPLNAASRPLFDPASHAPEVWALLQKSGGQWQVRRWAMPADVVSIGWAQEFPNVPQGLWPQKNW